LWKKVWNFLVPAKNTSLFMRKPRILISPLDWGLGHATRCIPIIRELLKHDCDVWLAADGPVKKLLAQEFPQLTMLQLQGYPLFQIREMADF
jgi:UDP:flavonoid glycosyltransferase YjiC (YdhE family)